jgi:hypothetical protein
MPRFALRLNHDSTADSADGDLRPFHWLDDGPSSTIFSSVGPHLAELGPVDPLNVDLVRIAVGVLAADRTAPRRGRGSNWNQRDLSLRVHVSAPQRWRQVAGRLNEVVGFLSGDRWELGFDPEPGPSGRPARPAGDAPERVVLLSGGADSAIGALDSGLQLAEGGHHLLLSHYASTMLAPLQRDIATQVAQAIPTSSQRHVAVRLGRRSRDLDGHPYPDEFTTRSRSLLFLALGLAAASVHSVPLWIPENGFASINPPLGQERLGSLSTRTTHPRFLGDLAAVLQEVGAHHQIVNPFALRTKGEMFAHVRDQLGSQAASTLLSATHSCALTGQRTHRVPARSSCGVCFGCVLRRASFAASGLADQTTYIEPAGDDALRDWLASKSVEQPVRNFVRRGVRSADLIAAGLPPTLGLADALAVCRRGVDELRGLY